MLNSDMPDPMVEAQAASDRRNFLAACGKFTLLLSTSLNSTAVADSGGRGNNGWGNGGGDGSPNGKSDVDR